MMVWCVALQRHQQYQDGPVMMPRGIRISNDHEDVLGQENGSLSFARKRGYVLEFYVQSPGTRSNAGVH